MPLTVTYSFPTFGERIAAAAHLASNLIFDARCVVEPTIGKRDEAVARRGGAASIERFELQGRRVWLKHYGDDLRSLRLRALDWTARRLAVPALRPPPRYAGAQAKLNERRRLIALARCGVRVPDVIGEGRDFLILGDIGLTLSARLRHAANGQGE